MDDSNNTRAASQNEDEELDLNISTLKPVEVKSFYNGYRRFYGNLRELLEETAKGLELKTTLVQIDLLLGSLYQNELYIFVRKNAAVLDDQAKRQKFIDSEGGALTRELKIKACTLYSAYKKFLQLMQGSLTTVYYVANELIPTAYRIIETKVEMELFGVDGKFIDWFRFIFEGFDRTDKVFRNADPKEVIFNYYTYDDRRAKRMEAILESMDRIMKERHPHARDVCSPHRDGFDWNMVNHLYVIDKWSKSFRENNEKAKEFDKYIEELKKLYKLLDEAGNEFDDSDAENIFFDFVIVLDRMIEVLRAGAKYARKFDDKDSHEAPFAAFHYPSEIRDVIARHGLDGGDPLKSGTRYKAMALQMANKLLQLADQLDRTLSQNQFIGTRP